MENAKKVSEEYQLAGQLTQQLPQAKGFKEVWFKKIRGGLLLGIGYLLSPLCWWNDIFFNLPIAYAFGYICSWLSPDLLFPCTIVGYWLSNIVGILLMQLGTLDVFTDKPKEKNLKKELLTGLVSSTAFTLVIVALIHFNVLDTPDLFSGKDSVNLSYVLPVTNVTSR
ncbi:hypothetical protein Osc7112_4655 [Oscillatoria nigro-viridis PCC 7112]|uniref:Uncharacterized protein n=1 Tax=Phormidium nigroviride PCC 7112 TaxID=179408 RepID=K9VNZ6_9CYAN|nr:hypothetical protein [Oscillatoria nigro-viridis]AFZ08945.1 hypothetical protein Osc7112_4655 [Oscillatoria nigro-viridis PCC 7112]